MPEPEDTKWIRIPRAAEELRVSEDTVRRMISDGRLDVTVDPSVLKAAASGRGRPPSVLVSLGSVHRARAEQNDRAHWDGPSDWLAERLHELEAELARTRSDLDAVRSVVETVADDESSRLRDKLSVTQEVALQALERDESLDKTERARLEAERLRIDQDLERLDADKARRAQLRALILSDRPGG